MLQMKRIEILLIGLFLSYAGIKISWMGVPTHIYVFIELIGVSMITRFIFSLVDLVCLPEKNKK